MTVVSLIPLWLLAQQPATPASSPHFEEEIVVTAERGAGPRAETPAAVTVLTRDDVERLPAESLAEVLDHVPGFQVLFPDASGPLPMVSTRGFFGGGEAEYVQLLVDGVPVADPESGLADWRRIRVVDVERVEVLRGPGSSAYGDTALGGVVQVFRRTAGREPAVDVAASGGTFGSWAADGICRGGERVPFGAGASASRTDGFREHSAGEEAAADLWLGRGNGDGSWSLSASGSSRDREEPGPLTLEQIAADRLASDPLFRFDREETRRGRAALSYRRAGGTVPLRAMAYGAVRDGSVLRTLLLAAGLGDRAQREIRTHSLGGSVEAEKAFGAGGRAHRVRAGLDLGRDWLDTSYRAVDDDGVVGAQTAQAAARRDRLGVFASGDWRASSRLSLAAGIRWDRIADDPDRGDSIDNSAWSPRAGATVRLGALEGSPVSAFVQVSRAFKAATLDQLFDPRPFPDFQGGSFTVSNPALTPQRASTAEAGLFQRRRGGRWEVVAYRTTVDDEIDFDPATFRYRNIGRTRHAGVEASARVLEGRRVSPHATYAWTRVEALEEGRQGLQLKNIPEHLLRAGLTLTLPGALAAEVRFTWSGRRWLDDANEFPFEDVRLLDLRLEKRFRRVRLRLDALNLTGTRWEPVGYTLPDFTGGVVPYAFPAPGRALRLGVEWGS